MTGRDAPARASRRASLGATVACWAVASAGGAVVVVMAAGADLTRCADGWTNRGQAQWGHAIAALVLTAPAPGRAAWLAAHRQGSARVRWAAVGVAVALPILVIALALGVLPDAPTTGTCFD